MNVMWEAQDRLKINLAKLVEELEEALKHCHRKNGALDDITDRTQPREGNGRTVFLPGFTGWGGG